MSETQRHRLLEDLLAELDVRPILHGGGTKSSMGGAAVDADTAAVMHDALDLFFDMENLLAAVGDGTAKVLGVESAAVVAGAASGCVLGAAVMREALPANRPAHLITQRRHYGRYAYLYEQAGCEVREVGTMNDCPLAWYADAIDENTVGIAWLEGPGIRSAGARLEDVCTLAAQHGLPVIIDAAAMIHPFETIRDYLTAGADLVVVSGGKLMGGPQSSGFVLGATSLVERIRSIGFPHQGVGRAHKITKEVALGAYAAARRFAAQGDERFAGIGVRAERIVAALTEAGVLARVEQNSRHLLPAVVAHDVRKRLGVAPSALSAQQLIDAVPIFFPHDDALDELYLEFASLDPQRDELMLQRLLEMLRP